MHRVIWDLHYASPTSSTHEYPITAVPHATPRYPLGPVAVPGEYTVRLTANGKSYTAPLTLKLDPRVKTTQQALDQQFQVQQRLANAVSRSSEAVLQIKSVQEQIKKLQPTGTVADALKNFSAKVDAALDGPENPPANAPKPVALGDVNGNAYSLYGMIGQVDSGPTPAQVKEANNVDQQLPQALAAWEQVLKTDLPAINAQLKQAGLQEIDPKQAPANGESQGDQE